ncbi:MAG: hypothetical protein JWP89_6141 [Schlesneria sp.]|nr:hypothetical protein [Schlesneria sp.]
MCQFQHRNTQNLPIHLTDKIGHPPKTLPWTDKFCHFVMFAAEVVSCGLIQRRQSRQEIGRSPCANNVERHPPKVLATLATKAVPLGSVHAAVVIKVDRPSTGASRWSSPGHPIGRHRAGSCGFSEGRKEKRNSQQCHEFRLRGSGRSRTDDDGFAIRCLSHLATEPTDQESAIGAWRLSFPRGRFRNTGLMPTSGNDCLTSRIVVTGSAAVNNQRSQF